MKDSKPVLEPFDGVATPKTTVEREIVKLAPLMQSVADGDRLVALINANPKAFTPKSRVSNIPLIGPALSGETFTQSELAAQIAVAKDAAQVMHALYGAAQSANEAERAKKFLWNQDDPPHIIAEKLRAAKEWAAEHQKSYSDAARAVARQRMPQLRPPLSKY
jgi:hypothetical protein